MKWREPQPSKLKVAGGRDSDAAMIFMDDLAKRLANRVQLTSDGHKAYLEAVEGAFGSDIDYAMLVNHPVSRPSTCQYAMLLRSSVQSRFLRWRRMAPYWYCQM
jgi:hypothetical protein